MNWLSLSGFFFAVSCAITQYEHGNMLMVTIDIASGLILLVGAFLSEMEWK